MNLFRYFFYIFVFPPVLFYLLDDLDQSYTPRKIYMSIFEKKYEMHWCYSGYNKSSSGTLNLSYGFNVEYFPKDEVQAFNTWYKVLTEILMFIPNVDPLISLSDPKLDAPDQYFYLTFHYPDFTLTFHPDLGRISGSKSKINFVYFKVDEEKLDVYREEDEDYNYDDFIRTIGFEKNTPFKLSDLRGHVADVKP